MFMVAGDSSNGGRQKLNHDLRQERHDVVYGVIAIGSIT